MKTRILTTTLTLFTAAAFAADPTAPPVKTTTTSVVTAPGGKATITIDVNGKKETREIEIGDGVEIKAGTRPKLDLPASAITDVKTVVRTTWLGVAAEEVSEELRAQLPLEPGSGLIVRSVIPESPAAAIGLQKNDVLMKLDDQLLTNPLQLRTLVSSRKEGDTLRLTFFRRGQQSVMEVKLGTHEEGGERFQIRSALADWSHAVASDVEPLYRKALTLDTKAVVLDKDGNVVGAQPDLDATVRKMEKFLLDSGADQKVIDETKRVLSDTTKAIRDALAEAGAAKQEIQKGASEIVKALEQARAAMEKARKLADEDAAKKEKAEKPAPVPLEKKF